jgi:thiamine pyrophosphate-dependent acetolactate synthase large subunit-like protein
MSKTTIKTSSNKFMSMLLNKIIDINGMHSNIYGLPGAAWYQANQVLENYINNNKINYIQSSNESSAIYQASYEAYSYNLKNNQSKVGISFVTAGPGTTMALTALGSALNESIPMVCFFGVPVVNFQFIDITIARTVCKYVFYIDNNTVNPQKIIDKAFQIALKGIKNNTGMGSVGVFVLDSLWNSTYLYTDFAYPLIVYPTNNIIIRKMTTKILKTLQSTSKIIIRIGERVNIQNLNQLIELSILYPNIYIHLTLHSCNYVNSFNMENVGIEGPLENIYMNAHYQDATHTIDIGQGIENNSFIYSDVKPLMNSNSKIFYIYNTPLRYKPSSMNKNNTLYVNPNNFIPIFITEFKKLKPFSSSWINDTNKLSFYNDILSEYQIQTKNNICTQLSVIANLMYTIYSFPNNRTDDNIPLIDDNLLYVSDIGLIAFVAKSFIHTKNIISNVLLSEFSPIGCTLSCTAGYLRTGNYDGFISINGDGGFMNVPGYAIDLKNVFKDNSTLSGLIFLCNDNTYTNIEYSEYILFNQTTSISKTDYLQNGINIGYILKELLGDIVNDYVEYTNLTLSTISTLQNYVNTWYNTKPPGITIIHNIGPNGYPITLS